MRKWLILLSALLGTAVSAAPAWTWVDANGTVHFSDRPVPGARQVELSGAQAFGSQPATRGSRVTGQPAGTDSATGPYQAIQIASPSEQETLWNIGATLNVVVRIQPPLQPGHRYDLVYDGQRLNMNTTNMAVTVPEVFRGTHTLQVVVLDSAGSEVMRSPSRTFYVQQASVLNPNSPAGRRAN